MHESVMETQPTVYNECNVSEEDSSVAIHSANSSGR